MEANRAGSARTGLSRRRSRVRVPSLPSDKPLLTVRSRSQQDVLQRRSPALWNRFGTVSRVVAPSGAVTSPRRIAAAGKVHETGAPFASEVVRVWTFHDGKAIRVRSYYDTHGYATALLAT